MSARVIKGHVGVGGSASGPALVADDDFSARYDLDRINGVFSRPAHKLYGESYVGKILVLSTAKGGVATAWMLYEMNPIMAQGAALADLPFMDRFEEDITTAIQTGDTVTVDPAKGLVKIGA